MELEQMLADLRAFRDEYAARFGYDAYAMGADMQRREDELRAAGWPFAPSPAEPLSEPATPPATTADPAHPAPAT